VWNGSPQNFFWKSNIVFLHFYENSSAILTSAKSLSCKIIVLALARQLRRFVRRYWWSLLFRLKPRPHLYYFFNAFTVIMMSRVWRETQGMIHQATQSNNEAPFFLP
jgi:hypothetical protein